MDKAKEATLPALFISHGSPMVAMADADDAYYAALHGFARERMPRPKAIVVVSAHGLSEDGTLGVSAGKRPAIIHDFGGFPGALYQIEYPCPGSPDLAARVASLLADAGFSAELSTGALLDHGVWVPVRLMYPEADIPVIRVTLPYREGPRDALKLGKALGPLREEGVLLIGSGGAVHNLGELKWHEKNSAGEPWAREFESWLKGVLLAKNVEALVDFEHAAPHAKRAHPTIEHFYPVFFTVGASRPGDRAEFIFEGVQYGTLSMLCFALTGPSA